MTPTASLSRVQDELEVLLQTTDRHRWSLSERLRYQELSDLESMLLVVQRT
jgi:hypothetical protein